MGLTFEKISYGFILALAFLLLSLNTSAQIQRTVFVPVAPETFSNSYVRFFYKDSKGYMWLGTADGLFRYDGTNTYRYEHRPNDKTSLSHNHINVIVEDSNQNLWIGTALGLNIYDREKDHFINVDSIPGNQDSLSHKYITSLSFDADGRLWIGTLGGGINIYDPETLAFAYLADPAEGNVFPAGNHVTSLLCVDDLMWCGTKDGVRIFSAVDKTSKPMTFVGQSLPKSQITQLIRDKLGNIWLSTIDGELFKLVPGNGNYSVKKMIPGKSGNGAELANILTICFDNRGNLWMGGEHSGLNYFNTKTNKITRFPAEAGNSKKLPTNSIRSVYVDNTGLTWIGTFSKGAYLIDKNASKFEHYYRGNFSENDLTGKNVRSFAEDKEGNVWIAYQRIGLIKLDAETNTLQNCDEINSKLANKYLTALTIDRYGNFWIGTDGKGVYKVTPQTNDVENFNVQSGGFGDNRVSCLYEDKKGVIWAGTSGSGLFYYDDKKKSFHVLCEANKAPYIARTSYVSCVLDDSEEILWVGTMYGLYALERKGHNSFDYRRYLPNTGPASISSSGIQTVYEDRRENLWIGTTDNGLNVKMKGSSKFKVFQKKDGLPSNNIGAIVADKAGNLWISGNMGLSKFNPGTNRLTNYTKEDGLASNNFYNNACLRSSTGKLFFGSNNGFNAFYPDSIQSNPEKPIVYLTDLKINNQSVNIGAPGSPLEKHISLTSEIELSYQQRSFRIDFVAINYGQSFHHKYCYKLEGFDEDWICMGAGSSATYTNIDPGSYVFRVKASNNSGVWSEPPTQVEITIRPLFWKTWWAFVLYGIVLTAVIFILIKIRIERVNMRNQLVLERIAREKEHELSESKTQFFANVSHEFRTPLSLISMPLENLISMDELPPAVKEKLRTIQYSANKMMRLVNELMDFNKLEVSGLKLRLQRQNLVKFIKETATVFNDLAEKRNIHFRIQSTVPVLDGWFDHDKLEKIVVNVLSNAFKFTSSNGEINIVIGMKNLASENGQKENRYLELVITDNGIGISAEELPFIFDKFYQAKSSEKIANPGTGIGLSLTKGLVELHHGSIKAESTANRETKFVILIPIDRQAYSDDDIFEISGETIAPNITDRINMNGANVSGADRKNNKPKVLIVEDNFELRKYISLELRREFNVLEAKDGNEGLEIALEKNPDLIVSDILMPGKSGIELCREIKSTLKTSHIPLILLTSKTTVDDQVAGVSVGADVYITKPFSMRFLLAHIRNIIESRQKLYSHFSQDVHLLPAKMATNEMDQAFLQKAIDYIVDNMQDSQLSVDAIADLFNLSRMQMYRKIKALTGKSVVEFIRSVRIKQALKLMDAQKYSLSEIAYQTGFNSASYFTRCFKDEFGKAPSEYLEHRTN